MAKPIFTSMRLHWACYALWLGSETLGEISVSYPLSAKSRHLSLRTIRIGSRS